MEIYTKIETEGFMFIQIYQKHMTSGKLYWLKWHSIAGLKSIKHK